MHTSRHVSQNLFATELAVTGAAAGNDFKCVCVGVVVCVYVCECLFFLPRERRVCEGLRVRTELKKGRQDRKEVCCLFVPLSHLPSATLVFLATFFSASVGRCQFYRLRPSDGTSGTAFSRAIRT